MARILVRPEGPKVLEKDTQAPGIVSIHVDEYLPFLWQSTVLVDGAIRYSAVFEISPAAAFIKALEFARQEKLVAQ